MMMRQLRWSAVLCLMGLTLSVKPAVAADPPTGGVEAGVNINTFGLSGSNVTEESGFKAGLMIGGFVSFPVTPMVSIQPEVVYAQKHSKFTGIGSDAGFTANLAFDFIEIPVLAKI